MASTGMRHWTVWRDEAERLRAAIRAHQKAILKDENFGADRELWDQAGYPGRIGPGSRYVRQQEQRLAA